MHACTHTLKVPVLQPLGLSLSSFRHSKRPGQLILKLQKLPPSVCPAVFGVEHWEAPSVSLKLLTSLNNVIWTHGHRHANLSLFFYLFWCIFDVTHGISDLSNGLYCFCTDTYDSMLFCSLFWGSEPFCNFRLRSPKSFPSTLPLPLYFHHSCLLYSTSFTKEPHYCPSSTTLCDDDDDDDVTLMPVSCSDCVLEICTLSVLACCSSVWSPGTIKKSMLKGKCSRGIGQKKAWWEEVYAGWRAEGPLLMAINGFGPFRHSFCCKRCSC